MSISETINVQSVSKTPPTFLAVFNNFWQKLLLRN